MGLHDDPSWSALTTRKARLRWARKAVGLSQEELADRAQLERRDKRGEIMGRGGYRRYEDEKDEIDLPYEHAAILARKLGVRTAWLYNGDAPHVGQPEEDNSPVADEIAALVADADPEFQVELLEQMRFMVARRTGSKG